MERRWGSDLTVFVAPPTDSSWSRAVVAALVEQRLSLVPKVQPACAAEADRAEATVAPPRDLHGRMGEANTLRKSRWKGELLLVKAQLQVFHRDGRRRTQ